MTPEGLLRADTLGIAADDDIDVLAAIEGSFGVRFGEETRQWFTVGDVYDGLLASLPQERDGNLCATSMAFHRVRAFLQQAEGGASHRIRPETKLREVTALPPKRLFGRLTKELGVTVPGITPSWWGVVGIAMLLGGFLGLIAYSVSNALWPIMLAFPLGLAMMATDRGVYGTMTVGDVARSVAANNFAYFAAHGADARPASVWRALCAVLAETTEANPKLITRDTRLLA